MSSEGGDIDAPPEGRMENTSETVSNHESNGKMAVDNALTDGNQCPDDHDQLVQIIFYLRSQNEFLKSQLESVPNLQFPRQAVASEHEGDISAVVKTLHEKIESLNKEIIEEKQTRGAAEEALKHLQMEHSEAEARALELSIKLSEAQQKLNQEIKEREEKYSELDSKFSRLHKRAKQRIQDIQKEKDDLEVRFREVSETSERAVSQQATLQQELERTRQQANEALKAIDAERQQLRSANNKLRDNIEELRNSLQPKENALERMQQSLLEKDQMLEDLKNSLQAAEERRQASSVELSAKHQKSLENLEAQLSDALSDRSKAGEIISGLQTLIAEKETKIAEMDAASTGEAARLRAAVETVKGEAAHLRHEHEKEKESLEASLQALKMKLEIAESNYIRAEIEAAKTRSQLESEISAQNRMLSAKDGELSVFKEEVKCLEKEFSSYKARAHALLQKKETELAAAVNSEQIKNLEETLEEAEKELTLALAEKDRVLLDLQSALANHNKELTDRDSILNDAKNQIKILESNLHSANSRLQSEKEVWEVNLQNVEETWRIRYDTLKAQKEASTGQDCQKELEELKQRYLRMKEEHHSFRDLADRMIEEKDREIAKLLEDNKKLHQSLEPRLVDQSSSKNAALQKQDVSHFSTSSAEQQILILARQQAQREEELAQSQRHILALQEEIEELERENRLHSQQQAMLKEEFRNMERMQKREGVDMTYLKNVVLKLLETGEVEALLPVIGMLLQFSPEEIQKCQQAFRAATTNVPPSPSSDPAGPTRSLFSRFSFA